MVTPWFPTAANPVSGIFVARDAALLGADHDVHVVHLVDPALLGPEDGEPDPDAGFTVERVSWSRRSPSDLLAGRRRLTALLAEDFDVLHTQAFSALLPLAGVRVRLPWIHSEHWSGIGDPASLTPRGRAMLRVLGRGLARPDVVTTVSSVLADRVSDYRSGPVRIVPSVVQPAAEVIDPPAEADRIRLVAVGHLIDGKDPLLAIATVRALRERGQAAGLAWVGDGSLRTAFEQASADDPDIVLRGVQDAGGVTRELDGADFFLLPTRGETLCLAALEAISHGRAVVMGARGGQRDYVTAENGRLVAEREADAYADAILDLWATRTTRTPQSIVDSLHGAYSPTTVRDGYLAAYREAAEVRSRRR